MTSHIFPPEDARLAVKVVRDWAETPDNASRVSVVLEHITHNFGYWLTLSFRSKNEGKEPFSIGETVTSALRNHEINGVDAPISRATTSTQTAVLLETHVSKYLEGTGRAGCKLYYPETGTAPIAQRLFE